MAKHFYSNPNLGILLALFAFIGATSVLVHDSTELQQTLSRGELQELISTSRPFLLDPLGHPIKVVKDQDYESVLRSGLFRTVPGATVAMVSPQNLTALVELQDAPTALLSGWSLEPLDRKVEEGIQEKQAETMWFGYSEDLWLQNALFWLSASLLFGLFGLFSAIEIRRESYSIEAHSVEIYSISR